MESDSKVNQLFVYLLIGGGAFWLASTDTVRNLFQPNVKMVYRETALDNRGSYVVTQELLNVGKSGNILFYAVQNEQIVCQEYVYLNEGERRTLTLECPLMRDGMTTYKTKPT